MVDMGTTIASLSHHWAAGPGGLILWYAIIFAIFLIAMCGGFRR